MNIREFLAEYDEEILCADGFDEAIIGVCHISNNTIVLYDMQKCIEILINRDGMTEEDALDFFHFNVLGSYVGEKTPAFAEFLHDI
jgi:hypothetical protein